MELRMNPDVPFEEIQKAVVEKFTDAAGFFKNARMAISFTGRTLTATEEEILIQTITETTGVELLCIIDQDEKNSDGTFVFARDKDKTDVQKHSRTDAFQYTEAGRSVL